MPVTPKSTGAPYVVDPVTIRLPWNTVEFVCDTFAELPTALTAIDNDTAFCVETLSYYKWSAGAWVLQYSIASTSIVPITGTLAQFNAALTDANFATGGGTVTGASSGTNTGDQDLSSYATTSAVSAGYQPKDAQLTDLAGLSYAGNALKVVRVNASETGFELGAAGGGSGANLTASYSATTVTIESDTGTDVVVAQAGANAGVMSAADKTKLDGIATAATANATDAALRDRALHTGSQAISTVTGLQTALDAKAAASSVPNASYRTLLDSTGSHIAGRTANTYGLGQGQPAAITGVGTLYALNVIFIDSADYPTLNGVAPKLRVRATVAVNDVAPTGTFTFGLHPVTRPGTSGGAGLCIYTIGAAVAGSTVALATPVIDSHNNSTGADFALPANGFYVLGFVSTATVAVSSHLHISMALQMRNA